MVTKFIANIIHSMLNRIMGSKFREGNTGKRVSIVLIIIIIWFIAIIMGIVAWNMHVR